MESKSSLPWSTKISYGVGHVFNDLCASMWFTYLLIFYQNVLLFDSRLAGLLLLVGQIADGLSTPVVGIFSDKENKVPLCARYGRRKVWHLLGTVLTFLSFPFIYNRCLGCEEESMWVQFGYYCIFVCIFQFGWACVQISHLALIPDLTTKKHQRTELNSIRYAFTVLSNLSVFTITFFVLKTSELTDVDKGFPDNSTTSTTFMPSSTASSPTTGGPDIDSIGPEDADKFRNIALICCGVGAVFSFIFHLGVQEPPYVPRRKQEEAIAVQEKPKDGAAIERQVAPKMRKLDWFKELPFYQIAILYMATRLYVNLYQVYIPLYVQETLNVDQSYVATVPFAMYLSGFAGSLIMKQINKKIGRKGTFALGCVVGIGGCVWVWFGEGSYFIEWGIFLVAALLGIGGSTLLITSLSITADLIGHNVEGGAFVYGFMSLVDKVSNGVLIMIIQNEDPSEGWYYRSVITFACGSSCLLGIGVILTLINTRVGQRKKGGLSPVMDILEESDTTDSDGGIDNPAASCTADEKPVPVTSISQLKIEDHPSQCQCELPKVCSHNKSVEYGKVDERY